MIKINVKNNKGFVILFAVVLSSIILAITLGVTDIAFREIKFSTSAKSANEAFFAADTGIELALFNDKNPLNYPPPAVGTSFTWPLIVVSSLGSTGTSCAKVSVKKDNTNPATIITTIVSKGYNMGGDGSCNSTSSNLVERELKTTYGGSALPPGSCDISFPNDQFHVCYFDGMLAPTSASTVLSQSTETAVPSPIGIWSGFSHTWNGEVDSSGKSDQVSGVWRGRINFQAGNYTFHTTSDDGIELNIEGFGNVISNWTDHGPVQDNSIIIAIPAGYRDVQLRFYESGGGAVIGLWWD